jgi:hypothetical protein
LHNGGKLCTAGAQQRGQSILDVTLKMKKDFSMSSKSIPSKITVIGYLQTQTKPPPHTGMRTAHTLAQMHTRINARRTRGALTYETAGAATLWRREQSISATRASMRRPSTRCKPKAKLRLDLAALRLVRLASREWGYRWVAVGDANSSTHGVLIPSTNT